MKEEKKKHGAGRPSKYRPEYCELLLKYMVPTVSYTDEGKPIYGPYPMLQGFAHSIGVLHETLNEWAKRYPEFTVAMKKAKAMQEQELFTGALSNRYNCAVAIFGLKNNHGWKDKQEHEVSASGEGLGIVVSFVGTK